MFRIKRQEALRPNWHYCSRSCHTIANNILRKKERPERICQYCQEPFKSQKEIQHFCSKSCASSYKNEAQNPAWGIEARKKISAYAKKRGTSHMRTPERLDKQRHSIMGENHWNWQGGLTSQQKKVRNSFEMKKWREAIFARDDYTCQKCNKRGSFLNADHVKPFALYPDLRFSLQNGRTLCVNCHRKTATYGGRTARSAVDKALSTPVKNRL